MLQQSTKYTTTLKGTGTEYTWPQGYIFLYAQLMEFGLLINLKLLTIATSFSLNIAEHENFSANKNENANNSWHFHIYWQRKFHAQLRWE